MTPKSLPKGTSVRVTWEDSQSTNGWHFSSEILPSPADLVSIGLTARSGRHRFLALTSTIARSGDIVSPLLIPWAAIKNLEIFRIPHCTKKATPSTKGA